MKSKALVLGIGSLLILSACAKKTPLTEEQKTVFKQTLGSAAAGFSTTANHGKKSHLHVAQAPYQGPSIPKNESQLEMESKLSAAEKSAECKVSSTYGGLELKATELQISGPKCPVTMDFSISVTQTNFAIKAKYNVQDDEFRGLNDVDAFDFVSDGKVQASSSSGSVDVSIKGTMHSQKNGNIQVNGGIKASGDQSSSQAKASLTFVFPKFEAELVVENNGGTNKFSINGEQVSETEFSDFFKMFE